MYSHILTKLNLSKNEALIYETLLLHGKSSVSSISKKSNIHRRNVYDTLNHLLSKGLVSEIVDSKENVYVPVDPKKLSEVLKEKELELDAIMPHLQELYASKPILESVFIYKGIEGWKNYLRDVLKEGEDLYTIGGKGAWGDERIETFLKFFLKEAGKKNIKFHTLYDGMESDIPLSVLKTSEGNHKFLPKEYSNNSAIEVFGDRVVIFSNIINRKIDNNATLTVIKNKNVADAFRTWFKMIWNLI